MSEVPPDFKIRYMKQDEVAIAIDWAAAEGWNPGLHDGPAFFATERHGFLIAETDDGPVAVISAVVYDATFGFLGFYIVRPERRGEGFGLAIWQQAMKRFGGQTIGLDGVPAQQENYRKSGFEFAYRQFRLGGSAPGEPATLPVPLASFDFEAIAAYDRQTFPAEREGFLRAWLKLPESRGLGLLRDGQLAGFGLIRRCREGFKIGPLVADDAAGADELFRGLTAPVAGEAVFIDVPEVNAPAVALGERYGLAPVFETARMYAGIVPEIDVDKIFGVTTFELG